jgi:hypothetical protein
MLKISWRNKEIAPYSLTFGAIPKQEPSRAAGSHNERTEQS